jgi:hypothetical protein
LLGKRVLTNEFLLKDMTGVELQFSKLLQEAKPSEWVNP